MSSVPPRVRLLLMLPALSALGCGVLSGLARLGVPMPEVIIAMVGMHGALMIGGFFGTVIALERAVALGTLGTPGRSSRSAAPFADANVLWPYAAPLFSGLGAIAIMAGASSLVAATLLCFAALIMSCACATVWLRQKVMHHAVLTIAAMAWLAGNLIWLWDATITSAVPWWIAFLMLTIAGERLELSRFRPTSPIARIAFGFIISALLVAVIATRVSEAAGLTLYAATMFALSLWLVSFDIARHTIKAGGLTRYIAICLLSGYLWLAVAGLLGVSGALQNGSILRDAALHALLLGFVFSMVFGHAPIILPAVSPLRLNWHQGFYIPLAVLHLSLAARVLAGVTAWFALRKYAAVINALALLMFALMVASSLRRVRRSRL